SRGIGRAIAEAFAREGAQTVLAAASETNLAVASDAIVKSGGRAPLVCAGDLRTLEACDAVLAHVKDRFGRCDILVNSAGRPRAGRAIVPRPCAGDGHHA